MVKALPWEFYGRDPMSAAPELLGKKLVRNYKGQVLCGIITETEAYLGESDSASHSFRGRTPRNEVMYDRAGVVYGYYIYGRYHMLNIVTAREYVATAVLIRALFPLTGTNLMAELRKSSSGRLTDGPGKLCKALAIDRSLNGWDLTLGEKLWIEPYYNPEDNQIKRTPRIGIQYARQKDRDALRRFLLNHTQMVKIIRK